MNTRRCSFAFCNKLHESKNIDIDSEEYTKRGSQYYHTDCVKISDTIKEMRDLWYQNIDENVDFRILNRVVSDLIFNKGYSADYILFCIRYSIENGNRLRFPPGLRYCVEFDNYKSAYNLEKKREILVKEKSNNNRFEEEAVKQMQVKPRTRQKQFGFGNILKGAT